MSEPEFKQAWVYTQQAGKKTVNQLAHEVIKELYKTDPHDLPLFMFTLQLFRDPNSLKKMNKVLNMVSAKDS